LFVLFHLGLALSMELGNFPWVCMAMWVALLPASFWDRLQARWGKSGQDMPLLRALGALAARLARRLPGLNRPATPPAWAPPGRTVGWILAVGLQDDGTHIDLLEGGTPIDDYSPATRPPFRAATFANGRWRKLIMNLELVNLRTGARLYPYLERGLARYLYRD